MKNNIYILLCAVIIGISCSRERMTEINIDPSTVDTPELSYLFSDALSSLQEGSYTEWFYDNTQYILPWMQLTVGTSGNPNGSTFNQMGAQGGRYSAFYNNVGGPLARIRNIIDSEMSEYEQASYQNLDAMTYILQIYYGLRVTDISGSMPYTEAWQGFYTNPPMLTPVFNTQEELLTLWDDELEEAIYMLTSPTEVDGSDVEMVTISAQQDFVYGGVLDSWIKLANSIRLRIAVRLYNSNPAAAIDIAEAVSSDGRIMSSLDDEFYWYAGEEFYNFGDAIWHGVGAKNYIDFLRNNRDPRLRFLFQKNDFNSMVMQGFLDQGVTIPSYILSEAIIDESGDTPKFKGWQGDGEPWVRYQGAPVTVKGEISAATENDYFTTTKFQLYIGSSNRTFYPTSFVLANIIQPNLTFTYPNVTVISDQYIPNGQYPFRTALVSAAETQLYLAEFKLLGANITGDANTLFQNGVTLSVESLNRTASDLNVPYYSEPYDKDYGVATQLQSDEISTLLSNENYTLSGDTDSDLEKVYINLIVDRTLNPTEVYVTCRRSGVPYTNSSLWAKESFSVNSFPIPRRFVVTEPSKASINYENNLDAYIEEGFTMGTNDPATLNAERLWYDKSSPDLGSSN